MRRGLLILVALVVALGMLVTACATEEQPIKISELNWGSAQFQSHTAKIIIEEGYGYPVELVSGATIALLQGLRSGDLDVIIEIWEQNQQAAWDAATEAGDVVELGLLNNDNWQSLFVVPTYVIEGDTERGIEPMAANLTSVSQLDQTQYKELFANPENPGKGGLLNCVAGWECEEINEKQLAAYGLDDDYDLLSPGSQESLFASLQGAYDEGDPWIGYMWGPTWISGALDLTLLQEPPYDETVWNENNGCAYPSVDLLVAGNKDFEDEWPDVADMFRDWKMSTSTLAEGLAYKIETGGQFKDAAVWFLKTREEVWAEFVPDDVAQKVRDAVAEM